MSARKRTTSGSATIVRLPTKRRTRIDPREARFNAWFGQRLREWREAPSRDWTQKRMATALGIGEDQYKKYEYGTRAFPLYLLLQLRTITDRSIAEWMQAPLSLDSP